MSTRASSTSKRNSDGVGSLGAAPKRLKMAAPITPSKKAVGGKTALETTPKKNKGPVMALEELPGTPAKVYVNDAAVDLFREVKVGLQRISTLIVESSSISHCCLFFLDFVLCLPTRTNP